ncbi:MAG: MFS transporter [Coriobacteriaceae bacterium]|nr:MFS transporter [Coriobacteriaceae bacterium]
MTPDPRASRRVIRTYLVTQALFTLAASMIWGINTLFLMDAGLDIFQVMLVNAAFTAGSLVFEVPTGVIADTVGRKVSFMFGIGTLFVSTLLYVGTARYGWGIGAFAGASVLLGLGYTFQTGAVDAWLVDALDATGYEPPKERVFGWGGATFSTAMLVGTLAGGALGQIDLALPYVVRSAILAVCMVVTAVMMRDMGFEPRPLKVSTFGEETRKLLRTGVTYGWGHPVVRPLLLVSGVSGVFMMYSFYSLQRYALDLLGRELVWVIGVLTAAASLAGIMGNLLAGRVMGTGEARRRAAPVLAVAQLVLAVLIAVMAAVGLLTRQPGIVPFALVGVLWLAWGVLFGFAGPIRQAYLNEQIPSEQRATVLSLDAFFGDAGACVGQPGLGWLSKAVSIPAAWAVGSVLLLAGFPLYRAAGKGEGTAEATRPGEVG